MLLRGLKKRTVFDASGLIFLTHFNLEYTFLKQWLMKSIAKTDLAYLRCKTDYLDLFDTLALISTIMGLVVALFKVRKKRNRQFPQNIAISNCLGGFGLSLSIAISSFMSREQMHPNATGSAKAVCYVQAMSFQFFTAFMVLSWIMGTIILYQVLAQKCSIDKIRRRKNYYQGVCFGITVLAVIVPIPLGLYGPLNLVGICWISNSNNIWRFLLVYTVMAVGMILFLVLSPKILHAFWMTRTDAMATQVAIRLRVTLFREVVYAVYAFFVFLVVIVYATNNIIIHYAHNANEMSYITSTTYTYCSLNTLVVSSFGLFISIIFTISYAHLYRMQKFCCKLFQKFKKDSPPSTAKTQFSQQETPETIDQSYFGSYRSPTNVPRDFCESAYDTKCATATSVAQDSAFQRATKAHTDVLLSHVQEKLRYENETQHYEDSTQYDPNCSTFFTEFSENGKNLDARLELAKAKWMNTYKSNSPV